MVLNQQPVTLATITIRQGAALVWGNVDGITLRVHYIMAEGEFIVGSEDCPFTKQAHIQLLGG